MDDDDIDDAITNGVAAIESVQHERGSPESEGSAEEDAVALTKLGVYTKRLRAENAAMRPLVEAVANTHSRLHCALGCRVNDRWNTEFHAPDCLITQARAFVAAHPAAAGESAGGDDERA